MSSFHIFFIRAILLSGLMAFMASCKESYEPPALADTNSFLVVEGFINIDSVTTIRLSRSTRLKDTSKVVPEQNAVLNLEDETNRLYPFSPQGAGAYTLAPAGLASGRKYRLRIKTGSSGEYLSDFIEAGKTPEIDSINFKIRNNGVQFYANTHDQENKTRYYRWEYYETWLYSSLYESTVQYHDSVLETRAFNNQIYFCWQTLRSNNILLGSSANLSEDVIKDGPVSFVSAASGKLTYGYSILIRQYALSEEAYNYWLNLKKNTEQLGSIFDAQPSIASGNIHCLSNPAEPVIGYLSASTTTAKRFYFDNKFLPLNSPFYTGPPSSESCEYRSISISPRSTFSSRVFDTFSSGYYIPTNPISVAGQGTIAYSYARKDCVDCRLKGGTNVKPNFWP
jgi:hypothetical protein